MIGIKLCKIVVLRLLGGRKLTLFYVCVLHCLFNNFLISCRTVKVRQLAYECLVKIVTLYYDKLQAYMQTLFNITMHSIKVEDPKVAMQVSTLGIY